MKKILPLIMLVSLLAAGYLGHAAYQAQSIVAAKDNEIAELKETIAAQEEDLQGFENQSAATKEELEREKELTPTVANIDEVIKEYDSIVRELFDKMMNFTPETYDQRKDEVAEIMSEELYDQYFKDKGEYYHQDSNDTTSKLDAINIYPEGVPSGSEVKGLVSVKFQSKMYESDWYEAKSVFEVTYNRDTKRIIAIVDLGSGFSGDAIG